ncbi:MAG: DUF99 family protein [Candidatus Methanomethyliaceae archaeon]|nr:DUF99 family protein [Candidatus Methanomethyliaceae archaeon]
MQRVLAVEGGSFRKGVDRRVPAAFLFAEGIRPKRLIVKWVEVDGLDATERLKEAIREEGMREGVVIAGSVPIAGFNLIDAREVLKEFGLPTVFVLRDRPDVNAVRSALMKHFKDWKRRLEIIEAAGPIKEVSLGGGEGVFIEVVGMGEAEAKRIIEGLTIFGKLPEPLRLARMVARSLSRAIGSSG